MVHLSVNEANPIKNEIIYGSVSGKKMDEEGNTLGGALIGIFPEDAKEFTEDTACATVLTAEDGSFRFEKVPYGIWIVREIAAPSGYQLSAETFGAVIDEEGKEIVFELVNCPKKTNMPQTGDEDMIALWMMLAAVSALVLFAMIIFRLETREMEA